MRIAVSVVLAFLLSGISQVIKDLGMGPIDRPLWAMRPTVGKATIVAATWWTSPFLELILSTGQKARAFAFGLLGVILQMSVLTGFIWLCISVATHILNSTILQVVSTAVFIVVGALFVFPLVNLIMMPLTLIVAWPLDLLFPLKERDDAQAIEWCPNCKHERKSKDFADPVRGSWHSETMPRSDELPCNIALETSDVWERYYSSVLCSRTLFPNDCPFFERRATRHFSRWRPRG
jgi:hypothetical protein